MANLKKRKSYSIVISILIFLTILILSVTASTTQKSSQAYDKAFNNMDGPHLVYWMGKDDYKPEYKNWFEEKPEVQSVKLCNSESYNGAEFKDKGITLKDGVDCILFEYKPSDNMRLIDAIHPVEKQLSKRQIYMPYIYETNYGVKTGDKVDYVFGTNKITFEVAGFIEDPLFGADMNYTKRFFLSSEDFAGFSKMNNFSKGLLLSIRLKNFSKTSIYSLEKDFNKQFTSFSGSALSYMQLKNDHLILPDIALVVIVAFALILCVITITILRYAILATIEADYLNIGILKALGFTPGMVQAAIIGQYVVLTLSSGILGVIAGIFITPVIGKLILNSSGLYFSGSLSIIIGLLAISVLLLVIILFSYMTTRRIKKISPVRAIANGTAPVYFSSRLNIKLENISFLPFNIRMALKQMVTKSKRYILLMIIAALLSYALVFMLGLVNTFHSEKAVFMVGGQIRDVEIDTDRMADAERIVDKIKKDYKVDWVMYEVDKQLTIDDQKTTVFISNDFSISGELSTLEGRHPLHENEIAISMLLKQKFNKGIGQYLEVRDSEGNPHQYLITGTFQTTDNDGENARMLNSGMKALDPGFELNEAYVKLKSHDKLDSVINEMRDRYTGYQEISNDRTEANDKISTVTSVFSTISTLVFVLTVILIGFITLLIMKITVYNEVKEFGIFKAVGFSSSKIRLQLAIRLVLVSIAGGIIGAVLVLLTGSQLLSEGLHSIGIFNFKIDFNLVFIIIPIIVIVLITMLSAYLTSANAKKVTAYRLINE
ncbi:MAG: ABC transporter permease [Bacillota bacterium]|nr:ABC transporter permease [Bacillota bacterium]